MALNTPLARLNSLRCKNQETLYLKVIHKKMIKFNLIPMKTITTEQVTTNERNNHEPPRQPSSSNQSKTKHFTDNLNSDESFF